MVTPVYILLRWLIEVVAVVAVYLIDPDSSLSQTPEQAPCPWERMARR